MILDDHLTIMKTTQRKSHVRLISIAALVAALCPTIAHSEGSSGTETSNHSDYGDLAQKLNAGDPATIAAVKKVLDRNMEGVDSIPASRVSSSTLRDFVNNDMLEIGYTAYSPGSVILSIREEASKAIVQLSSGVTLILEVGNKPGVIIISSMALFLGASGGSPQEYLKRVRDLSRPFLGEATDDSITLFDGRDSNMPASLLCESRLRFDPNFDHSLVLEIMAATERVMKIANRPSIDSDDLIMARGGIGAVLAQDEKSGYIFVVSVMEGGAAAQARMAKGDIICGVDGNNVMPTYVDGKPSLPFSVSLTDAIDLLKGKVGTSVKVVYSPAPHENVQTLTLERGKIPKDATQTNRGNPVSPSPHTIGSDAVARELLVGTWMMGDGIWHYYSFNADGSFLYEKVVEMAGLVDEIKGTWLLSGNELSVDAKIPDSKDHPIRFRVAKVEKTTLVLIHSNSGESITLEKTK